MSAGPTQLRVLYVITDLLTGGVPLHMLRLCRWMKSRGHYVEVFCLAPPGPVSEALAESGIAVVHGQARSVFDVGALLSLARQMRRTQPHIVHSMLFHANLAARLGRALVRFPTSRTVCEIQTVEIERHWHLWVDGLTQKMCRCEIGNSPSVIHHLAARAHIQSDRLVLVRGGIDPATIDQAPQFPRSHWGLRDDAALAVWAGRLDPIKGLDDLIGALAKVNRTTHLHLAMAGTGEYEEHVRRRVGALGMIDRVHFLGRRDDVASLLKAADIFVFPSYTEGLPNALLEAMACRLPIVTTDVPGCRDLIIHEHNGLLAPPRQPDAIAASILRLMNDSALARRLGTQARADLESSWSLDATFAAYLELYLRAADRLA